MALSAGFRQAMKSRTRRWRRQEVVFFFVLMAMGLSDAGRPFQWGHLAWRVFPILFATGRIFRLWQRVIPVSSLDDRAVLEYGVEFEGLAEALQKDLLRRYQVGTYLLNSYPDEFQAAQEAEAHLRAHDVMKLRLPALAVVYWVGWLWLPDGRLRAGWTDAPMVLTWMFLLVLALPQMVLMWTEPDEMGELRVIERGAR
jgi:hypothetical protein